MRWSHLGPPRSRVLGPLLVALAIALPACAGPTPSEAPLPTALPPTSDLAPRPDPLPDPDPPDECDPSTRAAIGAVVKTQLDAFAAEDFTTAFAMTSRTFRSVFTAEDFATTIRTEYPELVGNGGHRLDECGMHRRSAFIVVGVRAGDREIMLRYDLSEESAGWRIDGAVRLSGITPPADRLV